RNNATKRVLHLPCMLCSFRSVFSRGHDAKRTGARRACRRSKRGRRRLQSRAWGRFHDVPAVEKLKTHTSETARPRFLNRSTGGSFHALAIRVPRRRARGRGAGGIVQVPCGLGGPRGSIEVALRC